MSNANRPTPGSPVSLKDCDASLASGRGSMEYSEENMDNERNYLIEKLIRREETNVRLQDGFEFEDVVGDIEEELVAVNKTDCWWITTVTEDAEFAKEVSSGDDYMVQSDEFWTHSCVNFGGHSYTEMYPEIPDVDGYY